MQHLPNDLCWIHIRDVYTFLNLGANRHEQKVGQNIKLDLSLQIPYRNTSDILANTVDYSAIIHRIQDFIETHEPVNLLEKLAEEILDLIGREFLNVVAARLILQKAFVPIPHFTGSVAIEASRSF